MSTRSLLLTLISLGALLGIADAAYLSWAALTGSEVLCNLFSGCDVIAASPYSRVFGIPVALYGFFFYLVTLGFASWGFASRGPVTGKLLLAVSVIGVAASVYFTSLEIFVFKAFCEYCVFSALDTVFLLAVSAVFFIRERSATLKGI